MLDKKAMLEKMLMESEQPAKPASNEQGIKAKLAALQDILKVIQAELGGKVKGEMDGLKKVEVVAPDSQSLEEGLELASEMAAEQSGPMVEDEVSEPSLEVPEDMEVAKTDDEPVEVSEEVMVEDENPDDTFGGAPKKKKYF